MLECRNNGNTAAIKYIKKDDGDQASDIVDWDEGGWADEKPDSLVTRRCPWVKLKRQYVEAREQCILAAGLLQHVLQETKRRVWVTFERWERVEMARAYSPPDPRRHLHLRDWLEKPSGHPAACSRNVRDYHHESREKMNENK